MKEETQISESKQKIKYIDGALDFARHSVSGIIWCIERCSGIIKAASADAELYSHVQDYALSGMKGREYYHAKFLWGEFLDFEGIQRDIVEDVQIAAKRAKYAIDILTTNWDAKPQRREDVLREHYGVVFN